ncbi:hypothetical protein EJB05_00143 [Eragrostis curvula]|uniref:No apical meristem-associated C-terminal domain-containing protein n=1 Tax=Eragrostis curvula TaxID=38414 RepID=A0A5J9WJH9_9POAL|nr:hypothetical protein EJB05_00143 [Eragrostis curvula]
MDPNQSNDGSQGGFPGGSQGGFPGWNPYMYGYQGPPSWLPPGLAQFTPNVSMMHPTQTAPQVFQPTDVNLHMQHDEEEVEEIPASSAPKGKGKRTKLGNFNPDEDVNLVKSWLEISLDPITSNAQKKDGLWMKILQRYNLRRESYPERTLRSLQSRWDIIKAEVGKFASVYADVIRENPSGMSDAAKTTHATTIFAGIYKHSFSYMHCWEIMKDEPKWQDPKSRAFANAARGDGFGEDRTNLGDDNSVPTESGEKRPMGRDRAKALKKKANSDVGSASSSEYAERMQEILFQKMSMMQEESVKKTDRFQQLACIDEKRYDEMRSHNAAVFLLEQKKVRIMREKHERKQAEAEKQEDERILAIDLEAVTLAQRVYYQAIHEEIIEKIEARRKKRQGN